MRVQIQKCHGAEKVIAFVLLDDVVVGSVQRGPQSFHYVETGAWTPRFNATTFEELEARVVQALINPSEDAHGQGQELA